MRVFLLFTSVSLLASCASAQPTCLERLQTTCQSLSQMKGPVYKRYPDGTILLDQEAPRREFRGEDAKLLNTINQTNLPRIQALFAELKGLLLKKFEPMAAGPAKRTLIAELNKIKLSARSYERCERNNDQTASAASYSHEDQTVLICPLMTHVKPAALVTLLSHELGHSLDLCEFKKSQLGFDVDPYSSLQNPVPALASFPFFKVHKCTAESKDAKDSEIPGEVCARDGEVFADYLSASVAEEYLRSHRASVEWSEELSERTTELVGFRLICRDLEWQTLSHPFMLGNEAQAFLGCAGLGVEPTICSATDLGL